MIQLFLSRGEHDVSCVLFHLFRHSLINAINLGLYPSWLILQYIQINYNIWLPLFWARTEVWTCSTEKKAVLWLMSQSECLKNKSSADQELFVLTNSCYSSYSLSPKDTLSSPLQQLIGLYFFSLVWKNKRKCWCRLVNQDGSARDETNNQNISYNSPRDGNPIVKVKVKNAIHHITIMSRI